MICRTCIRRATTLGRQSILPKAPVRKNFSTTIAPKQAAATAAAPATDATKIDDTAAAAAPAAALRSICVEGTVLNGLNYFKGKTDPVARKDEEYPEWLWSCLDVQKKAEDADDTDAGDQWSKSKKQRQLAAKRQRALEAKILATGDLEALAPKVPLQQQTINLPGSPDGSPEEAIVAVEKREELRKAMRKERKAKIKEDNYLKSM